MGTVSNVLNRPDEVSTESVERVIRAIDELGYVRNDAARKLRGGVSTTVGFVVLDGQNPFYGDVVRGAEDEATRHGIAVLYGNTDEARARRPGVDSFPVSEGPRVDGRRRWPKDRAEPRHPVHPTLRSGVSSTGRSFGHRHPAAHGP